MNSTTILIICSVLVTGLCVSASAQAPAATLESSVREWLLKQCEVGEEGILEQKIRSLGVAAQPLFIKAFREGPDEELLRRHEEYLKWQYEARKDVLDTRDPAIYGEEYVEKARRESKEDYVQWGITSFVKGYKANAIAGLGLVADEEGKEFLGEIANDKESPFNYDARAALAPRE